jgi:hypothetical protein
MNHVYFESRQFERFTALQQYIRFGRLNKLAVSTARLMRLLLSMPASASWI